MTRILVADDHDMMRRGLRDLLESERDDWQVCGEAASGREAVAMAIRLRPDIAVLDLSMPDLNGLEATRQIRRHLPTIEILIYTMHETDQLVRDVLYSGARGYLLKSDAKHSLLAAIESLSVHRPFFTAKVSETLLESYLTKAGTAENVLSSRERGVIQLIAEGNSNKQIANILNISVKTVETHRAAAMRKLNLTSAAALVRYAIRNKIIEA